MFIYQYFRHHMSFDLCTAATEYHVLISSLLSLLYACDININSYIAVTETPRLGRKNSYEHVKVQNKKETSQTIRTRLGTTVASVLSIHLS